MQRVLIANRGEIAIRVSRAIAALGWESVGVYAEDDRSSLHLHHVTKALPLKGVGPAAYMDIEQLLQIAKQSSCDGLHPGIGFLSERPALASACAEAGVVFIGPDASVLQAFGDKVSARELAASVGLPVLGSAPLAPSTEAAKALWEGLSQETQLVVKAAAGGGGRGMRVVRDLAALEAALPLCQAEALSAFGDDTLYVEEYLPQARHVEVQLVGDGALVTHLWTRECSLQRRFQKLIEIAPAPWLAASTRTALLDAALTLGRAMPFCGLVTVEFLVGPNGSFYFLEVNPRLQVEHTVTEEVTGIDLVQTQLQLFFGEDLRSLALEQAIAPLGVAVQARVNMETLDEEGEVFPSSGTITHLALPTGPGVRVDTMGYVGLTPSLSFDSLLAKVIVHSRRGGPKEAIEATYRALCDTRVEGIETNLPMLRSLCAHPKILGGQISTTFVDEHREAWRQHKTHPISAPLVAGSKEQEKAAPVRTFAQGEALFAQMDGTITTCQVNAGEILRQGQPAFVMAAMKMEHVLSLPVDAKVLEVLVAIGQTVRKGEPLLHFAPVDEAISSEAHEAALDLDEIRQDLATLHKRHEQTLDKARPRAVEKRHQRGGRTARENIEDLCDQGSFVEYGGLALAAQRGTLDVEKLIERTPADGIIVGVARVNGALFGEEARVAVLSYDYTVFAGTQGYQSHRKTDRILQVAHEGRLPVIFFTEGGGGRPNDTDLLHVMISGLECASFRELASLQGKVPLIGVNHGRCFAGNAALLGCCDVIIATKASNIGMGGPAMIEGGGLGVFPPEAIGPIEDQVASGVVDIVVDDEAEAVAVAKRYLSYFQGKLSLWEAPDQRRLRHVVPENRLRVYDVKEVLSSLCDVGSVMELQSDFTPGLITALARIEGHPIGIIANNPAVLAGAIDAACARKACRMMTLCERFGLPLVMLCDTPGFMVGPEAEKEGTVRAAAEMFTRAARLSVPFATVILRKGYGLGAQAMAGGHFKAPRFLISWPTGEFGPMGLEGAVKLGFRRQLEAIEAPEEREAMFTQMVEMLYERGKAINIASHFEIDDVIDPIDTRTWIKTILPV